MHQRNILTAKHQRVAPLRSILPIVTASIGLVLFLASDLLDGREAAASLCATVLAWGYSLFAISGKLAPRLLMPRVAIAMFVAQAGWMLILAFTGHSLGPVLALYSASAVDEPALAILPLLIVPSAAFMSAAMSRIVIPGLCTQSPLVEARPNARKRRFYLVSGALMVVVYWPASQPESGFVGYVFRILGSAMATYSFVAGLSSRDDKQAGRIWIVVLGLNALMGMLMGTRQPFISVITYSAGWLYSAPRHGRRRARLLAGGLAVALMVASGVIGIVRGRIGRGGVELVSAERARTVVDASSSAIDQEQAWEVADEAISRMVAWCNVAVPILSPMPVPFRGYESIGTELEQVATINRISGRSVDDLLASGLGTAPATNYGFTVNSQTSVEFSVLADGWSRDGAAGAFVFAMVAMLFFAVAETLVVSVRRSHAESGAMLTAVLSVSVLELGRLPLLACLRRAVLDISMAIALVAVVEVMSRIVSTKRATISTTKKGPGAKPGPSTS